MRQKEVLLARCRAEHIEPPGRADRIINSANATADERFVATTVSRGRPRRVSSCIFWRASSSSASSTRRSGRMAGGCRTYRDTAAAIVDAGFTITDLQHVRFPDLRITLPTSANILGTALRA